MKTNMYRYGRWIYVDPYGEEAYVYKVEKKNFLGFWADLGRYKTSEKMMIVVEELKRTGNTCIPL